MEKDPKKITSSSDEIDVVSFFQAIGNLFSALFRALKNLWNFLLDILVVKPYAFAYRYKRIILPLFVGLMILAAVMDGIKKKTYRGEMLVSPFFDSGKDLYNQIEYLNSLIATGDYESLSKIFDIPVQTAKELIDIDINPNYNPRIDIKYFNEYVKYLDSVALKSVNFNEFSESFQKQKFDYPQHVITLMSHDPLIFSKANTYFDTLFEKNKRYLKRKEVFLNIQSYNLKQHYKSLNQIDSLRKSIDYAIKHSSAYANLPSSSVIVGSGKMEFPEEKYDLFRLRRDILNMIAGIKKSLTEQSEILKVNAFFPEKGEIYHPLAERYKVSFLLAFVILLILAANLTEWIARLNRKIQQNETSGNR